MNSHVLETSADTHCLFTNEELSTLDVNLIPKHVAIIMDGNRTWALNSSHPSNAEH